MPRWCNVKSDQLFCLRSRKNWFSKSTGCSAKLPLLSTKSLYNLWHLKNFWANSSEILLWENLSGKNFEEHYVQLFLTFLQNTMYRVALTLASFALTILQRHYNSVEGNRSNPVLAVKRSLFVEIRFLRCIFFRPPARYFHWDSNAMLYRPVACQMTKLEQIKA